MPNFVLPIQDLQDSVERPVIFDIIREVMDMTQISHKTQIMFLGDEDRAAQQNSTITKDSIKENKWNYNEKITIEVDEDYDRNRLINTYVKQPETSYIFKDDHIPIFIKPVYSSSEVKITVKYRTRDKNQANSWRNDMRTKVAMMRDINLHEIDYSYHLQEEFIEILKGLYKLRENIGGYGETWDDYFVNRLTSKASIVTNLSGTQGVWAIAERQIRVQGYFDFEGAPEKGDREGDQDNWGHSFVYAFKYEKPIECNMKYPIMVHNQLIPEIYRYKEKVYKLEDNMRHFTLSGRAYAHFESDTSVLKYKANDGVCIPSFDEFVPNSVLPSSIRVVTALASITPENKIDLINLNDLGDLNLDPMILEFLAESEYPFLGKDFQSIFTLSLYRDWALTSGGNIFTDSKLNVKSTKELSVRVSHRVRLGLVTDLSYLTLDALRRLRKYPLVVLKLIDAINSALGNMGNQSDIKKNALTSSDIAMLTGVAEGSENVMLSNSIYSRGDGTTGVSSLNKDLVYTNRTFGRGDRMTLLQSLFVVAEKGN